MIKILTVVFLACLWTTVRCQSPQETKFFNKMNTMVSSYLSLKQYQTVFSNLTDLCMTKTNASDVMSQFVPILMKVLSGPQLAEVAAKGVLVSSKVEGGLTTLLNNLGDALYNNLLAFCQQLVDLYKVYQAKG